MKYKRRSYQFEAKEISAKGEFSGYLSVFHTIDAYKERVMPGAFEDTLRDWKAKGRLPPILWQHRAAEPLGPYTKMHEDTKGLYVEGELMVDEIPQAAIARTLMIKKVVTGQSIGFETIVDQYDKETGIFSLIRLNLWEGSIVTFPANVDAQVEAVKSMLGEGKMPSLKEFEEALRDVGFSRTQAKAIVGHGYAGLLRDAESRPTAPDAKSVLDEVFAKPIISVSELFT